MAEAQPAGNSVENGIPDNLTAEQLRSRIGELEAELKRTRMQRDLARAQLRQVFDAQLGPVDLSDEDWLHGAAGPSLKEILDQYLRENGIA